MPYSCRVVRLQGPEVTLRVEAEQPDCEPFYSRTDFALALLLGDAKSALTNALALGDGVLDAIAAGSVDAAPYVASVDITVDRRGSLAADRAPVALYTIRVTREQWLVHLAVGESYGSYAWCENGPIVDEGLLWEPNVALPVETYVLGDRVSVHADLAAGLGQRFGRGVVDARARCTRAPHHWKGGLEVARVNFDHGPIAWVFAETLRRAPQDTYERAAASPGTYFDALLAMPPLDRARALRWMALRGGGDTIITAEGLSVAIAGQSVWLYGLLRRLPYERAVPVAVTLIEGWARDAAGANQRFGVSTRGTELSAGDTAEPYLFEYDCPLELSIGALTLLVADQRERDAGLRLDARVLDTLAGIDRDVPPTWLGYAANTWHARFTYLLSALPTLPTWVLHGYPPGADDAAQLGLPSGAFVPPSDLDRFRP